MVLEKLCQISLQNKFRFKKPVIKDDGGALMEEAEDDGGDEMGGDDMGGDLQDMANQEQSDDEDIAEFAEPEGDAQHQEDMEDKAIIHSNITREEWLIECERVAHKLKLGKVANDGKEWRSHLDQTRKFADNVQAHLPDVRSKLERLSDDVSKALERISKKEQILSRSFEGMTGDY
jgi:intraflagellar transport protein 57